MTTIRYAIKVTTDAPERPCHISELVQGDKFYLISGGKRSELRIATSNPYRNGANPGEEQWSIDYENA